MRMMISLVAGSLLLTGARSAHGESAEFNISFELEGRAPDRLCVFTPVVCARGDHLCPGAAELSDIASLFVPIAESSGDRHRRLVSAPDAARVEQALHGLPVEIKDALLTLIQRPLPKKSCGDEDHEACVPELDLREVGSKGPSVEAEFPGQIMCTSRRGTRSSNHDDGRAGRRDAAVGRERVAFMALTFNKPIQAVGQVVQLFGTTATIRIDSPRFPDKRMPPHAELRAMVRMVGGDYATSESSTFISSEPVPVRLHPRCHRAVAEVPAHAVPIESISLEVTGAKPATCTPEDTGAGSIPLVLPFSPGGEKQLVATYQTTPPTTAEARWSGSMPPWPLRLGVHSIQFSWRRPVGCLADQWSELVPRIEGMPVTWTESCPRATLPYATECSVTEQRSNGDVTACEYHCEARGTLLQLPIPVTFDRVRVRPHAQQPREEVLYSWRDQVESMGHELTSVVAPADRRVMLEFADPSDWKDRFGDQIDAIKVVSGQSTTQLDLRAPDRADVPPRWVSLPSAGRTCSDRVRVAVTGTRHYNETTFEVTEGRIELRNPSRYRPNLLFYGLAGAGELLRHPFSNARSAAFADLGLGGQVDLGGSWSLNVEVIGQLTHTFYEGIELSTQRAADFTAVPYLRFDLRGAVEWWYSRRLGGAVAVGVGLGTPLDSSDAHLVGALRLSMPWEVQPVFVALLPRRLWFLPGLGCRTLEKHADYRTDFIGTPTTYFEKDWQCYLFFRLRAALE
jgi:hypothetical protein